MNEILFIADFFANQINGGGEINNQVLIEKLQGMGIKVKTINSHFVTEEVLAQYNKVIVANFVNLSDINKDIILKKEFVIYEHDHKYLRSRDPSEFKDYLAPKDKIINRSFYQKAKAVLCQTTFHTEILKKNLGIDNIFNLSGNLWPEDHLDILAKSAVQAKQDTCAIMDSPISHKGTQQAIFYCKNVGLEFHLIKPQAPKEFLQELGKYQKLVFFPKTPETFSRIVAEARMMGMSTITSKNIGVIHEEWFAKKGLELIDIIRYKQQEIVNTVLEKLHE